MNKDAIDLESLIQRANAYPPLPMAVVDAGETYVMEGAWEAAQQGLIEPVLVGNRSEMRIKRVRCGFSRYPNRPGG